MKLHEDTDAFRVLLSIISGKTGIREEIIEKDYYLTRLLSELASWQNSLPAYFKGDTAFYKAIGSLKRFSEVIELAVDVQDCPVSLAEKRLETAANGYTTLPRTSDKIRETNRKGSITGVYEYQPVNQINPDDALWRFGYVQVEATLFPIREPVESLMVAPLLYTEADSEQRSALHKNYAVFPFEIKTINMERIFADKILAAEFYYQRRMFFDTGKHLYDLILMMKTKRISTLLTQRDVLLKRLFGQKPFADFLLFKALENDFKLRETFSEMQRLYVFNDADIVPFADVITQMGKLYEVLRGVDG